jgi:aspartate/glutamate racemase
MHIRLIGGIGPAATDFYYRRLIAAFASRKTPLEPTIAHADTPTPRKLPQDGEMASLKIQQIRCAALKMRPDRSTVHRKD